jgi:hypothetical protein
MWILDLFAGFALGFFVGIWVERRFLEGASAEENSEAREGHGEGP